MGSHDDIPIKYHKIKNIFLLKRKIGKGSFGIIYTAQNINSKEYVAVKFEKISIKKSSQTLLKEAKILHIIYKDKLEGRTCVQSFRISQDYILQ